MLLDVIKVEPQPGHILLLEFENGEKRRFEMSAILNDRPFNKLKDSPLFFSAKVTHGSVSWPGNIDIAPEMLYDLSSSL